MCHVTRMNEWCHTYKWVVSHIWKSDVTQKWVTHINKSCRTYEGVMSHIWMSHVTHMNGIGLLIQKCLLMWHIWTNESWLNEDIFEDPWISGCMWHREPFSLWDQFCYLVLLFLGLFLSPCIEDGFNLGFHLRRGFRVIEAPAVLVVHLFPILTIWDIPSQVFLYFQV